MIINSQSSLQVGWSASAADDDDTDHSSDGDNGVRDDLPKKSMCGWGGTARYRNYHVGDDESEVCSRHQHHLPKKVGGWLE